MLELQTKVSGGKAASRGASSAGERSERQGASRGERRGGAAIAASSREGAGRDGGGGVERGTPGQARVPPARALPAGTRRRAGEAAREARLRDHRRWPVLSLRRVPTWPRRSQRSPARRRPRRSDRGSRQRASRAPGTRSERRRAHAARLVVAQLRLVGQAARRCARRAAMTRTATLTTSRTARPTGRRRPCRTRGRRGLVDGGRLSRWADRGGEDEPSPSPSPPPSTPPSPPSTPPSSPPSSPPPPPYPHPHPGWLVEAEKKTRGRGARRRQLAYARRARRGASSEPLSSLYLPVPATTWALLGGGVALVGVDVAEVGRQDVAPAGDRRRRRGRRRRALGGRRGRRRARRPLPARLRLGGTPRRRCPSASRAASRWRSPRSRRC